MSVNFFSVLNLIFSNPDFDNVVSKKNVVQKNAFNRKFVFITFKIQYFRNFITVKKIDFWQKK